MHIFQYKYCHNYMDNLSVKPTPVLRSHYIPAFVQNLGGCVGLGQKIMDDLNQILRV